MSVQLLEVELNLYKVLHAYLSSVVNNIFVVVEGVAIRVYDTSLDELSEWYNHTILSEKYTYKQIS